MKRMHIEKGVHGNKRERAKDNKKGIQQCAVATEDLYNTSTLDVVHLVLALRHTMAPYIDCCSKCDKSDTHIFFILCITK